MFKLCSLLLGSILLWRFALPMPVWEQLPGPYGGVIVDQAIDKNGHHFALFGGALYLSNDGALSWQMVTPGATALQIGGDDLIYAQAGDGLYFSVDGVNWNKLPDGPVNINLNAMAISAAGDLYLADTSNLLVSKDRAISWEAVDYNFDSAAQRVKIAPSGALFVFGNNKVFKSSTDGVTWQKILDASAPVQDVFISSNNKIYAAVGQDGSGTTFISTDGGINWQGTSLPFAAKLYESPQGWLLGANASPLCLSSENAFISLNGGSSYSPLNVSGPVYNIAIASNGDIFLGSDGIYKSTNSGGTFEAISPNRAHVYAMAGTAGGGLIAVSGVDSCFWRFWRSNDGGATWREIDQEKRLASPHAFYELENVGGDRIWLSLGYQTDGDEAIDKSAIYESTNGGVTWKKIREFAASEAHFDFDKATATCYAWTTGAKYFDRSTDWGVTWDPVPTPFELGHLRVASQGLVYGYSRGDVELIRRVYISYDYGEPGSWDKADVPYESGTANLFVNKFGQLYKTVSQIDSDDGKYALKRLYRSTDYGETWQDIRPDSGKPTWKTYSQPAIAFDENGGLYLWSAAYILRSQNAGNSWTDWYGTSEGAKDIQSVLALGTNLFAGHYEHSIQRAQKEGYAFAPEMIDGLELPLAHAYGAVWVDYDVDGLDDLFIVNDGPNLLYKNLGNGQFRQIVEGEIVTDAEPSRAASWADYNNDGFPDCYVTNWNEHNSLYKNLGDGTFKKITSGNIVEDRGGFRSCAWIDINKDGHLDIYIANVLGKNILYINDGTNHFTKSDAGAVGLEEDETYGIGFCDFDADGDYDIYLANYKVDKLYEQTGDLVFELVPQDRLSANESLAVGCSWGDYDNDGWMDLFVANADAENILYRNNGDGSFARVYPAGIADDFGVSKGSAWADVDNDGDLDLFVANNGSHFFYANDGSGGFEKESLNEFVYLGGSSLAAAFGDRENDGDLDLVIASYDMQSLAYRNDLAAQNWIKVKCIGTMTDEDQIVKNKSNRSAVGARVRLLATIGGKKIWQTREIMTQSGHASQNSIVQHFGLGDATKVDSLIVDWPSGTTQRLANLSVNRRITLLESGSTEVEDRADNRLMSFGLFENYPNPFNPSTTIAYTLPAAGTVRLALYDTRGRLIRRLYHGFQAAGYHSQNWDGMDEEGMAAASGVYFCVLEHEGEARTIKLSLLR